jgi:hypothetical protein
MTDEPSRLQPGQRVRVTLGGRRRSGTVADVTYTPKRGDPVVAVELDEPGPDGRTSVAVGPDEVSTDVPE